MSDDQDDVEATARYHEFVSGIHRHLDELEAQPGGRLQLSPQALDSIKEAVRAEVRHGAQVEVPPTDAGPFTVSEYVLRSLVRRAVDAVPGASALRTAIEYAAGEGTRASRGAPVRLRCRMTAGSDTRDLRGLADDVRDSISTRLHDDLQVSVPTIDIHIEDLHEPDE